MNAIREILILAKSLLADDVEAMLPPEIYKEIKDYPLHDVEKALKTGRPFIINLSHASAGYRDWHGRGSSFSHILAVDKQIKEEREEDPSGKRETEIIKKIFDNGRKFILAVRRVESYSLD